MIPVFANGENDLHSASLVVVKNGQTILDKTYDSLEAIIADGYDLERMCDWSNYSFHD